MIDTISKELEDKIIESFFNMGRQKASSKFKVSEYQITKIWKKYKLQEKIEDLFFNQGLSYSDIANKYNGNKKAIFHKLTHIKRLTPEQEKEIIEEYGKTTCYALAERYNVSFQLILETWHTAGLNNKPHKNYKYYYNEDYFSNIMTDEQAYWVGFIMADGCISKRKNGQDTLSFTLSSIDENHIKKFRNSLESNKPISYYNRKSKKYSSFSISSNKMSSDLQKIGVSYRKTYSVKFPNIPEKFFIAYLRGYFDGDGSISHKIEKGKLGRVQISFAGFKDNLSNIKKVLENNNIKSCLCESGPNRHPDFKNLKITSKEEKYKFLSLLYKDAPIYLDRKYELAKQYMKYYEEERSFNEW